MEEALKEIARYTSALKRLARAEQTAAANLASRYTARRAEALAALSPAARRLHDAMQVANVATSLPTSASDEALVSAAVSKAMPDEEPMPLPSGRAADPGPSAVTVVERDSERRVPRR